MRELMSKRKWFVLLCIEISYLLLGACFFYRIESVEEVKRRAQEKIERREIEELLTIYYKPSFNESQENIFEKLTEYCGKPMHADMSNVHQPYRWDFYHSLFFVITVVSTIGYGNLAPTTMLGRIVMIFYGLVGIPINGIVMVTLGEFFGEKFTNLHERWKSDKIHNITANLGLVGQIALYLIPGFTFFIFMPSVIIMIFEGWDYDLAVYYAFVTLTTIGFGDYVAGVEDNHFGELLFTSYKIFLLVWIIIGLGYVVMVLGFISRGLRSKKVQEIERLLAENLRRTPYKFRALKSLVYEILLMRLKPVYKKGSIAPIHLERRAYSLPDLTLICDDFGSSRCRKRAMSETNTKDIPSIQRVQSDSNLDMIDKELTFTTKKEQQQHELLRKMSRFVNSYEAKLNQACGVDCFTEEEILESEKYHSQWTIGSASLPKNQSSSSSKTRSSSITKIPYDADRNDVTWYGQTASLKEQEMREKLKHGRARSRTLPVQQEPLLKPPTGFFTRLRKRFVSTDSYKENDIEKQEVTASAPQIKINRRRAQSESHNIVNSNLFTSEVDREVQQLARLLIVTLAHHDEEPKRKIGTVTPPDYCTPRSRRLAIRPVQSRRSSLVPPSPSYNLGRRFSLRPSVGGGSPPPYSPIVERPRRFSLRPVVNISNTPSPVQRQRMKNMENRDNVIIEHEQMK